MLEHHSHFPAVEVDVGFFVRDVHALEQDLSAHGHLQQVQAPQERGFAGAGGADDYDYLAFADVGGDSVQSLDFAAAERFAQFFGLNDVLSAHCFSASFPTSLPGR